MATKYSSWVVESHGGKTRAYVKGYVESQTDKTATIYVYACANCYHLTQYGVRVRAYINGSQVSTKTAVIKFASTTGNTGACSGRVTIEKGSSGKNITISAKISGETVNGYGPIAGSATASTTVYVGAKVLKPPSAPSNLTAMRNAEGNIVLSWTKNATNATYTLIDRCEKGGSWQRIYEVKSVLDSYVDSPGIGSFKYRVCYRNADGNSGYSNATDYIVTLCAPAAPSLVFPASGATLDVNIETALLKWRHNPIDASPQTGAELAWSTDNETFTVQTLGTESEWGLPISGNGTIYWRVRTKGAHEDFGPWSAVYSFLTRTGPVAVLNFANPVTSVPIPISWEYEDAEGTQTAAVLEIYDEQGSKVHSKMLSSETTCVLEAEEFTPIHLNEYSVVLTVTSTTSLSYRTEAVLVAEYVPPAKPSLSIAVNAQRGAAIVTPFSGPDDESTPSVAHLSLFRDGQLIAKGLNTEEPCMDETPPLDVQVKYRVVAYSLSGAIAERTETVVIPSGGFAFFNFDGQVAKVGMNIAIKDETQNEREYYTTASSRYPKVFYGDHSERAGTITADAFWAHDSLGYGEEAMLPAIKQLKEHDGVVYLRLPHSDAFHATVDVSTDVSTDLYNIAAVSIEWRRVT